jgi:hypothetical protein
MICMASTAYSQVLMSVPAHMDMSFGVVLPWPMQPLAMVLRSRLANSSITAERITEPLATYYGLAALSISLLGHFSAQNYLV